MRPRPLVSARARLHARRRTRDWISTDLASIADLEIRVEAAEEAAVAGRIGAALVILRAIERDIDAAAAARRRP